jgi:transposase
MSEKKPKMRGQYLPLTDGQWEAISEYFNLKRKRKASPRSVVDAIRYIPMTGCQWRNLPPNFPKWRAVYYYFDLWEKDGTTGRINMALNMADRKREGKEALPSLICIDSQSVKLSPFICGDRGLDGNKLVNGRKKQMAVDVGGRVFDAVVHAANIHDGQGGIALLAGTVTYGGRLEKILGDASYKGAFAGEAEKYNLEFECASRPETEKGFVPVPKRWVVERTIGWTNFFRRLVKDYEYTTRLSRSWLFWGNIQIMLNRKISYTGT